MRRINTGKGKGKDKGKNKSKDLSKDITTTTPQSIQQLIFEDVKNINKFNIIAEEFILSLQNKDKKAIDNLVQILVEIFDFFFFNNKDKISSDLVVFLNEKLDVILNVLIDVVDVNEDEEEGEGEQFNLENILNIFNQFFKFYQGNLEKIKFFLSKLIDLLIFNPDGDLVEPKHISSFTNLFSGRSKTNKNNMLYYIYEIIQSKMEEYSNSNTILSQEVLFNLYNFIVSTNKIEKTTSTTDDLSIKQIYQNILIKLINQVTLPKEILENLLLNLNKFIFDNLENPLIFSDYLINIYEKSSSDDFDIKVLSLSGLFILLTKYKLDYPNYYTVLYRTLCMKSTNHSYYSGLSTVLDSKYKNRFFKILELSLKSPTVPVIVIFSFIKRLARISLQSNSSNTAIILGIIQNLIKVHPRTVVLLLRKRVSTLQEINEKIKESSQFNWEAMNIENKENFRSENVMERNSNNVDRASHTVLEENIVRDLSPEETQYYSKYEQFNDSELDPYKTKAHFSCLWELYTLKLHFSFKIRNLANKFENNFLKSKEFDMGDIEDLKEEDMLYLLGDSATFYTNIQEDQEEMNKITHNIITSFI